MTTLPLPPMVGSRKRAHVLADSLGGLQGKRVVVDCRDLIAATESFADELITEILIKRDAAEMHFINVSDLDFANWVDEHARIHDVGQRVKVDRKPVF